MRRVRERNSSPLVSDGEGMGREAEIRRTLYGKSLPGKGEAKDRGNEVYRRKVKEQGVNRDGLSLSLLTDLRREKGRGDLSRRPSQSSSEGHKPEKMKRPSC